MALELVGMLVKGLPAGSAGWLWETSTRLSSSLRLGRRQSPALDPSLSPLLPLASRLTSARALVQVAGLKVAAFFSQTRPVSWSVTVPSELSVKRVAGQATPAKREASSPAT